MKDKMAISILKKIHNTMNMRIMIMQMATMQQDMGRHTRKGAIHNVSRLALLSPPRKRSPLKKRERLGKDTDHATQQVKKCACTTSPTCRAGAGVNGVCPERPGTTRTSRRQGLKRRATRITTTTFAS